MTDPLQEALDYNDANREAYQQLIEGQYRLRAEEEANRLVIQELVTYEQIVSSGEVERQVPAKDSKQVPMDLGGFGE